YLSVTLCPYTTLFRSAEHGRTRPVDDRDTGVPERAPAHHDPTAAVALQLVARAEPTAEHGDDLAGRHVLARHLNLRHGLQGSARSEEHTSELQSRFDL